MGAYLTLLGALQARAAVDVALCPDMFADLLTSDGWSSVYSIEAILLQIRMAMCVLVSCPLSTAASRG